MESSWCILLCISIVPSNPVEFVCAVAGGAGLLLHDVMMKPGLTDGGDRRFWIAEAQVVTTFPLRPTKFLLCLKKGLSLQDGGLVSASLRHIMHDEVNGTHIFDFSFYLMCTTQNRVLVLSMQMVPC